MKTFYPTLNSSPKAWLLKPTLIAFFSLLTFAGLQAQPSGGWDATSSVGTTGSNDYGNGVYRLLSDVNTACAGASISETSVTYDPASGTDFNECYKVFFGCPGNDNIGSGTDQNGDGMAFSFSKGPFSLVGNSCGGGLGYMEARNFADTKMITIEFDTYSSMGNSGFDLNYGGGTSGINDEISLHIDGQAGDNGLIEPVPGAGGITNAGNLEDGLEHLVCIKYDHITHELSVTIDGVQKINYDLDLKGKDFVTYFGAGGLSQTWSSGKNGATNPATVSHSGSQSIASQTGGPLCPAGVEITSPANGDSFTGCPVGAVTITATATPPAGNTVVGVEFFVDGVSIGTDNSFPYSITWTPPANGSYSLTATADFSVAANVNSVGTVNISVGELNATSTAPTIDGTIDALWSSYGRYNLDAGSSTTSADLDGYYKIMYDNTYLYVLVDVNDDVLNNDHANSWEDDAVEVMIDIGNDKVGCCTYGGNDYQYIFEYNSTAVTEYKHGTTAGVTVGRSTRAGGYIMEYRFTWSDLGAPVPVPGTYIGFEVKLDDDDDGGTRDSQLAWKDGSFNTYNNPSLFGTHRFSSCNPLPVELLAFTGERVNETVALIWATISEKNNSKFIVERSGNQLDWEVIGEVHSAGNSNSIIDYDFVDQAPLSGTGYYRLLQIDINGESANSNVVAVQTEQLISISPNPFTDALTIESNAKGNLDISIYDVVGRLMYQVSRETENGTLSILPELPSGAYMLTIRTETFIEQHKVIKK